MQLQSVRRVGRCAIRPPFVRLSGLEAPSQKAPYFFLPQIKQIVSGDTDDTTTGRQPQIHIQTFLERLTEAECYKVDGRRPPLKAMNMECYLAQVRTMNQGDFKPRTKCAHLVQYSIS